MVWPVSSLVLTTRSKVSLRTSLQLKVLYKFWFLSRNQHVCFSFFSNDETATEGILKCCQILSNCCGLLDLTFPRDAFIMSMCKASLPSQCSLSVLSVPSLSPDASASHHNKLSLVETGPDHKPASKTNSSSPTSGFPTMVAGMVQGAHNGPVSVRLIIEMFLITPYYHTKCTVS